VTNAVVHANKQDKTKNVVVTFSYSPGALEIEVSDQGNGFNPASVPDPTDPANIMKTSGRGIFLIRNFMDNVEWFMRPEGGTTLRMTKKI